MDIVLLLEEITTFGLVACSVVLLASAAWWLMLNVDEIAAYRAPWLTTLETWFVRLVWLSLLAAYLTALIYAPDPATRAVFVGLAVALFLLFVALWGWEYWNTRLELQERYDRLHTRRPLLTKLHAAAFVVACFYTIALIPPLLVALVLCVCYGALQYHLERHQRDVDARTLQNMAERFRSALWGMGWIGSFVHEHEWVSTPTVRLRVEFRSREDLDRVENWLTEDIARAISADRLVLREVTDKWEYEDPDTRTIADVWVYRK